MLVLLGSSSACLARASPPRANLDITLEDGRLSAAVRSALLNDAELGAREIAVEARGGIVALSGSVRSQQEAHKAEALTRAVPGVKEVKSTLTVGGQPYSLSAIRGPHSAARYSRS